MSFSCGTVLKIPHINAGEARREVDPWFGNTPWSKNSNPLQCSCLEDAINRGIWQVSVHGVTESDMPEHAHIHDIGCI